MQPQNSITWNLNSIMLNLFAIHEGLSGQQRAQTMIKYRIMRHLISVLIICFDLLSIKWADQSTAIMIFFTKNSKNAKLT